MIQFDEHILSSELVQLPLRIGYKLYTLWKPNIPMENGPIENMGIFQPAMFPEGSGILIP